MTCQNWENFKTLDFIVALAPVALFHMNLQSIPRKIKSSTRHKSIHIVNEVKLCLHNDNSVQICWLKN